MFGLWSLFLSMYRSSYTMVRSCLGTHSLSLLLTCSSCTNLGLNRIKNTSPQMLCWWLWKVINLELVFSLWIITCYAMSKQLGLRDAGQFSEFEFTSMIHPFNLISSRFSIHNIHQLSHSSFNRSSSFISFLVQLRKALEFIGFEERGHQYFARLKEHWNHDITNSLHAKVHRFG